MARSAERPGGHVDAVVPDEPPQFNECPALRVERNGMSVSAAAKTCSKPLLETSVVGISVIF